MAVRLRGAQDSPAAAPGVPADDLLAVVRVHLDRVHDAVRRLGCAPGPSVELVESSAVDLAEAVAQRPDTVEDAVGWWLGRAATLGRRVATRVDLPVGGGVLSADDDQQVLSEALDELPERERLALLMRDSYRLPATSIGAALGTDDDGAMELVGRARLAFLPLVDDEPAPALAAHSAGPAALARLAEGGPVTARDATARRHALSCAQCRAVSDAQERAHLLLNGLTVVALPEAERAGVLGRVEEVARSLLPSGAPPAAAEGLEVEEEDDEPPRLFSPLLALLAVVLAVLAGLGIGLLTGRSDGPVELAGADGRLPPGLDLASPQALPRARVMSPPTVREQPPETSVFVLPPPAPPPPPKPSPPPPPSPVPTATTAPPAAAITLTPPSGPNGTAITVSGTGFTPGPVTVEYRDAAGTSVLSRTEDVVAPDGTFTAQLSAQDPTLQPGPHQVAASDGSRTAAATFTATA